MTRLSERDIRDLLTPKDTPAPPAGLAERIKRDIPEPLEAVPSVAARFPRSSPLRRYLLAAAVAMAFGGTFLAYRVQQEMTPGGAVPHEDAVLEDTAPVTTEAPVAAPAADDEIPAAETEIASEADVEKESKRRELQRRQTDLQPRLEMTEQVAVTESPAAPASAATRDDRERSLRAKAEEPPIVIRERATALDFEAERRIEDRVARSSDVVGLRSTADRGESSSAIVRRSLLDGRLPPPEAVQIDDLVNEFDLGDASSQADPAIQAEGAPSPFGDDERDHLLRLQLRAGDLGAMKPQTIAAEPRVRVAFNAEIVSRYRLVGRDSRQVAEGRVSDESLDAGNLATGRSVIALYEVQLRRPLRRDDEVATLDLFYSTRDGGDRVEAIRRVTGEDFAGRWDDASAVLRLTSLVAEFGESLKQSDWARSTDLDEVARRARLLAAERPSDAGVAEFARLAGLAAELRRR